MSLSVTVMQLFETLATNAHFRKGINEVAAEALGDVKEILLAKDAESLKRRFSDDGYLADTGKVTAI